MLAGAESKPSRLAVSIVGRGDTDYVEILVGQFGRCMITRETLERPDAIAGLLAIALCAAAGASGDCRQLDIDQPEVAAVDAFATCLLEKRPVGLVEDHAETDHTGPKLIRSRGGGASHAD